MSLDLISSKVSNSMKLQKDSKKSNVSIKLFLKGFT
jgi:hypothetical protein